MKEKQMKGITLIALVITIIILIILAGVAIATLTGPNGIITNALKANEETEMAKIKEEAELYRSEMIGNQYLKKEEAVDNYRLLLGLNTHFTDSTIQGNAVVVENEKYDVIVYDKLKIKVQKHEKLKDGEIGVSYEKELLDQVNLRIHFSVKIAGVALNYTEYAQTILNGKTQEEKEALFIEGVNYWEIESGYINQPFSNVQQVFTAWYERGWEEKECKTVKEFLEYTGISSFDEFLVDGHFVKPEQFIDPEQEYDKILIWPNVRQKIVNAGMGLYYCDVNENETYEFTFVYGEKQKEITIIVNELTDYELKNSDAEYSQDALVMQYRVAAGTTISLPRNNYADSGSYNYTVDWGDGTKEQNTQTHEYKENGRYNVIITGTYKIIFEQKKSILEVVQWGNTGLESVTFNVAENLKKIAEPSVNSFQYTEQIEFSYCDKLIAIPENLFANCPNLSDVEYGFAGCSRLTAIPENLFANCPNIKWFNNIFSGCSGLTSIPENLFANCTNAEKFNNTFSDCFSLTSIPENLFANCPKVTEFVETFKDCSSLKEIPRDLFINQIQVTDFLRLFSNCVSLTSIPENIFMNNGEVTNFSGIFEGCTNIKTIPQNLFRNNTKVQYFAGSFQKCTNLQSIPITLFDNCNDVETFFNTFLDCENLKGPAIELWTRGTNNQSNDYKGNPDGEGCYANTQLDHYEQIPEYWRTPGIILPPS